MNLVSSLYTSAKWCEETRFTRLETISRISGNLRGRDSFSESRAGTGILAPPAGNGATRHGWPAAKGGYL